MLWIDTLGRVWETRMCAATETHEAKLLDAEALPSARASFSVSATADWHDKYRNWYPIDLRFMRENGFFRVP